MKQILVTRLGGIGDMVMIEPAIRAIYARHAPCQITLRTYPGYEHVLSGHPLIEGRVLMDSNAWSHGFRPPQFDHHYNFHQVIETHPRNHILHGVDVFLDHCNLGRPNPWIPQLSFPVDRSAPHHPLLVHLHSAGEDRDLSKNSEVLEALRGLPASFVGPEKLPWDHYTSLIRNAGVVLATDTGTLHLAAAMGHPKVIGLYTSQTYQRTRAYPGFKSHVTGCLGNLRADLERLLSVG